MTTTEATKRRSTKRRAELLAIAAELFAERGFAGVTVDEIGAAAGISGPALYHHFDGKEAVLGEMLVGISAHLLAEARAIRARSAPESVLDELIAMHVDFAVDRRALITVHFRDLPRATPDDQRRVRTLQRQYAEIWVNALIGRNHDLGASVARAAIHAVFGLINSTPFSTPTRRTDMVNLLQAMAAGAFAAALDSGAPRVRPAPTTRQPRPPTGSA